MTEQITDERLALAKQLVEVLENGDTTEAEQILDRITDVRQTLLFQEIGKLTRQLHDTLRSFAIDSRIAEMTEKDIPDAKDRLNYVISMTEMAANQTLNVIEEVVPLLDDLRCRVDELSGNWERFLLRELPYQEFKTMSQGLSAFFNDSKQLLDKAQSGLNDVLMAQSFQDVTGQIIRRVIALVHDLETSMVDLIRLSGTRQLASADASAQPTAHDLPGPAVPGIDDRDGSVATSQDDVDELLSSLGF